LIWGEEGGYVFASKLRIPAMKTSIVWALPGLKAALATGNANQAHARLRVRIPRVAIKAAYQKTEKASYPVQVTVTAPQTATVAYLHNTANSPLGAAKSLAPVPQNLQSAPPHEIPSVVVTTITIQAAAWQQRKE